MQARKFPTTYFDQATTTTNSWPHFLPELYPNSDRIFARIFTLASFGFKYRLTNKFNNTFLLHFKCSRRLSGLNYILLNSTKTFLFVDTNECSSSPCQNGGQCSDQVNGYICNCADGYEEHTVKQVKYHQCIK